MCFLEQCIQIKQTSKCIKSLCDETACHNCEQVYIWIRKGKRSGKRIELLQTVTKMSYFEILANSHTSDLSRSNCNKHRATEQGERESVESEVYGCLCLAQNDRQGPLPLCGCVCQPHISRLFKLSRALIPVFIGALVSSCNCTWRKIIGLPHSALLEPSRFDHQAPAQPFVVGNRKTI